MVKINTTHSTQNVFQTAYNNFVASAGRLVNDIRLYFSFASAQNLNGKVPFPVAHNSPLPHASPKAISVADTTSAVEPIFCRQITLVAMATQSDMPEISIKHNARKLVNEEALQTAIRHLSPNSGNALPEAIEDQFTAHETASKAHYILDKKAWKGFLQTQFIALRGRLAANPHAQKEFFKAHLDTANHAMVLEGEAKRMADGSVRYKLRFYDPNATNKVQSVSHSTLDKITQYSIRDFLPSAFYQEYAAEYVHVYGAQLTEGAIKPTETPQIHLPSSRSDKLYSLLLAGNVVQHAVPLARKMQQPQPSLAQAHNSGGSLMLFMDKGNADLIAQYLKDCQSLSQSQQLARLLSQEDIGHQEKFSMPYFLQEMMAQNKKDAVSAYLVGIKNLNLPPKQLQKLVEPKDRKGHTMLSVLIGDPSISLEILKVFYQQFSTLSLPYDPKKYIIDTLEKLKQENKISLQRYSVLIQMAT